MSSLTSTYDQENTDPQTKEQQLHPRIPATTRPLLRNNTFLKIAENLKSAYKRTGTIPSKNPSVTTFPPPLPATPETKDNDRPKSLLQPAKYLRRFPPCPIVQLPFQWDPEILRHPCSTFPPLLVQTFGSLVEGAIHARPTARLRRILVDV